MIQGHFEGVKPPEKLYYSFNKHRLGDFSALVGVSYFYKNRHMVRAEAAYGNRFSNLVFTYSYRFGLRKEAKRNRIGR